MTDEKLREEVLALMAKGYGRITISETLGISLYYAQKIIRELQNERRAPKPQPQEYPQIPETAKPFNRDRNQLIVGLFDCHLAPIISPMKTAMRFIERNRPDAVVLGGDFLDCDEHNRHPRVTPIEYSYGEELDSGNRVLDHTQAFSTEQIFLTGNHDRWPEFANLKNPKANKDVPTVAEGLHLKERGIKLIPENDVHVIGRAGFTHGDIVREQHTRFMAQKHMRCIFYGHTHDVQVSSIVRHHSNNPDPIVGVSCGCLCNKNPAYMRNKASRWVHAFLILELRPDGSFSYYVPHIINGGFTFAGKDYFA